MDDALEHDVVFAARTLATELNDVWGHVTVRVGESHGGGFLLKHLRVPPASIDPDEVMHYSLAGARLSGEQNDPWEIPLYTAVYKARPDVSSVIHIHPPVATALSAAGATLHAISHEGLEFGDGLPTFSGHIIDNDDLASRMVEVLGNAAGCMLRGHGAVVVGTTLPDAFTKAIYLERTARQTVWASTVGTPAILPEDIREHITARRGDQEPPLWRYMQWRYLARSKQR